MHHNETQTAGNAMHYQLVVTVITKQFSWQGKYIINNFIGCNWDHCWLILFVPTAFHSTNSLSINSGYEQ